MAVQKKVQKSTTKKKKRKNRKKRYDLSRVWMALGTLTVILLVIFGVAQHQKTQNAAQQMSGLSAIDGSRPDLDVELQKSDSQSVLTTGDGSDTGKRYRDPLYSQSGSNSDRKPELL